jgi:chitin-binding protein
MKIRSRLMLYAAAAVLAASAGTFVVSSAAQAHGAMMVPGSRTYMCWKDGIQGNGAANPRNPACAAAVAQSGPSSLYNWFAVLRSNGAGRTTGFIPDGQLCSGGTGGPYDFTGFNLARADFPTTHLTAGRSIRFDYNNWAKHPGTFYLYVTKDSWSPTRPLAWSDLESTPFSQVTNPESIGGPGTNDGRYSWNANLPAGKSGRHIIYSVWSRSDSQETFYGCSDVTFDGGNGEVTGIGDGGTTTPPTNPGPDPGPSTPPSAPGACTATYTTTNSWGNGFQGSVSVSASSAISSWRVQFAFPDSQTVSQAWNAKHSVSGTTHTLQNESYNGSIPANGSTTVGFQGSGSAPSGLNNLTCSTS